MRTRKQYSNKKGGKGGKGKKGGKSEKNTSFSSLRNSMKSKSIKSIKSPSTETENAIKTFYTICERDPKSETLIIDLYNVFVGFKVKDARNILEKIQRDVQEKINKIQPTNGGFPPSNIPHGNIGSIPYDYEITFTLLTLQAILMGSTFIAFMYHTYHGERVIKRLKANINRRIRGIYSETTREHIPLNLDNYTDIVMTDHPVVETVSADNKLVDPIGLEEIEEGEVAISIRQNNFVYFIKKDSFDEMMKYPSDQQFNPMNRQPFFLDEVFTCKIHYGR